MVILNEIWREISTTSAFANNISAFNTSPVLHNSGKRTTLNNTHGLLYLPIGRLCTASMNEV